MTAFTQQDILPVIEDFRAASARPFKPKGRFEDAMYKSPEEGITFYNWECPQRSRLRPVEDDEFTCDWYDGIEGMRLVKMKETEERLVSFIQRLRNMGIDAKYCKFLAGTNPRILYPRSADGISVFEVVRRKMQEYVSLELQNGNISIVDFGEVYEKYRSDYDRVYGEIKREMDRGTNEIITRKLLRAEQKSLERHCGVAPTDPRLLELSKRVCASYATEEWLIKTRLARDDPMFRNPVSASNEAGFDGPDISAAYLRYMRLEEIPKIFIFGRGGERDGGRDAR